MHFAGCNQLVRLEYSNRETTFSCLFLNESDTFKKSCNITYNYYGKNGIRLSNNTQGSSSEESPGIVSLRLDLDENQLFNYTVTAASTTFSIILEGRIDNCECNSDIVLFMMPFLIFLHL